MRNEIMRKPHVRKYALAGFLTLLVDRALFSFPVVQVREQREQPVADLFHYWYKTQ